MKRFSIKIGVIYFVLCTLQAVAQTSVSSDPRDRSEDELQTRCGVNCMYAICKFSNVDITYDELLQLLHPTASGVSMLTLKQVGEGLGFDVQAMEIERSAILKFGDPMIAFVPRKDDKSEIGHFVVIIVDGTKQRLTIVDPPRRVQHVEAADVGIGPGPSTLQILTFRKKTNMNSSQPVTTSP